MMVALQGREYFLLRLPSGQSTDPLGQSRRGVVRDNTQADFQGRKAVSAVVAGLLEGIVKATPQLDGAEEGGNAAPVATLLVFAGVVLTVLLRVLGSVLRIFRLEVVEHSLNDQAATLVEEASQLLLELEGGGRGEGGGDEGGDEGRDLLAQAEAGLGAERKDGLKFQQERSGDAKGQDDRISHGDGLSHEGDRDRVVP